MNAKGYLIGAIVLGIVLCIVSILVLILCIYNMYIKKDKSKNKSKEQNDVCSESIKPVEVGKLCCPKCGCNDISKQVQDYDETRKINKNILQDISDFLGCSFFIVSIILFFINFIVGIFVFFFSISLFSGKDTSKVKVRETIGICNNCGNTWTINKQDM